MTKERSAKKESPAETAVDSLSLEQALTRLDEIVRTLDDGKTDLETALARYEEGVALLRRGHDVLQGAQRRIDVLRGIDETGRPLTETVTEDDFRTEATTPKHKK